MIGDSFWTPTKPKRAVLLAAVVLMVVFHQSGLFGLIDSTTLVFGWLPAQLAYDIAYLLVGFGILYAMYIVAPEPPAEHEPTVSETDADVEPAVADGGHD
jgi:uncharacterized membrane protein YuzA (DUF378 family)